MSPRRHQLVATVKLDVLFQWRNKLYAIGLGIAVLFGLACRFFFSPEHAADVLSIFYLTGIGVTTYFFGAVSVLLEKSQGTLQALRTSPLTSTTYILSKVITLTAFAAVECFIVYAVGFFGVPLSPAPWMLGIFCLGVFQVLVGLGQVASHDAVTSFLIPGASLIGTILQMPVFYVLAVGPPWIWYLIPTQGSLLLILAAFEPLSPPLLPWQWAYALFMCAASIAWAWWWAKRRFARFIGLQEA